MKENMRISYRPLWVILAPREMSKKDLRELSGISTASLAKLGKGENITTDVLLKICQALNCNINQIIETVPDEVETKEEPFAE
jgi:DNA-binding Xre family transcriptional regulator